MTDQEQIAEMAVLGCVRNPQSHTAEECAKCDFKHGMCNAYRHAEALYNTGYRKLPEDSSVVLSREEQEKILKATESRINKLKEQVKQERKETAEKIYLQAKAIVDATKHIVQDREYIHIDALKEIIKNCGVEIKE